VELIDCSVNEILRRLDSGAARSADLALQCVARTDRAADLNCYVAFDADVFLRQAREADERRRSGERLALLGVPIAVKDNIQALGFACGNGTAALDGQHPRVDAGVVQRLRAAGAIITGKLGMHELAFGITNNNAVTGPVRNPWDPLRIPGGSSGGSGAAVAAGLVSAAIGTDTGGSVRVPAALCGVAGLRPTVGRVSREGIAPISTTRDTAGPLARCVADLALLDGVLSGDSSPLPDVALRGLRLGVPRAHFWEDLEPGLEALAETALEALARAGVTLVPVELPGIAALDQEVSFVVALYEFGRDMRAYLCDQGCAVGYEQLVAGICSPDVKALAPALDGAGAVPEAAYRVALQARERLRSLYVDTFATNDVAALVFPTTPCTAARIGDDETFLHNGRACPTFGTFIRNTDPASNAALPGLSLPMGLSAGLPAGLALDGPAGSDRLLLAIGAAVEAVLPPAPRPPFS